MCCVIHFGKPLEEKSDLLKGFHFDKVETCRKMRREDSLIYLCGGLLFFQVLSCQDITVNTGDPWRIQCCDVMWVSISIM